MASPNMLPLERYITLLLHFLSEKKILYVYLLLSSFQANHWKGKISTDVQFPLSGLDMHRHVASRANVSPKHERKYSQSKKHAYSPPPSEEDCIYDLFSVCNHIGPYMTSGHYTAYCKNSVNGNWYCFDDTEVSSVLEEQVCTRSAYLLFYQKRSLVSRSFSLSSLSSSASLPVIGPIR